MVATVSGEIITTNRALRSKLAIDEGAALTLYELFDDSEPGFRDAIRKAAGTSGWQHGIAMLSTGDMKGLQQKLRLRGIQLDDQAHPAVMICLRDADTDGFREHTRLIKRLNQELSRQLDLKSRLQNHVAREEYLHRELIHRVKNNLTVLSGIIRATARGAQGEEAREALATIDLRTRSIALVHELLDRAEEIELIEARELILDLCKLLNESLMPEHVTLNCTVDSLILHNEDATALCLLINKLVTNSLKHAFKGKLDGRIVLDFRQNGVDKMELRVRDDGSGSETPDTIQEASSHGTQIIKALAQQLSGDLSHSGENGTEWTLVFQPRAPEAVAAQ